MLFAHLKRILRLERLRLRGPNGARDEFLLAATAQNLCKMAKLKFYRLPLSQPTSSTQSAQNGRCLSSGLQTFLAAVVRLRDHLRFSAAGTRQGGTLGRDLATVVGIAMIAGVLSTQLYEAGAMVWLA